MARYEYLWTHAMNSDETYAAILKFCDFSVDPSPECRNVLNESDNERGNIDIYNIYGPPKCDDNLLAAPKPSSIHDFGPCSDSYVHDYLNCRRVQKALHANVMGLTDEWKHCRHGLNSYGYKPPSILPNIRSIISSGIPVWLYSGDMDSVVPVSSTRYSINKLRLPIENSWRPWYTNNQVGGYVVEYKGLVFATVRGAGHTVPSYQPERALTLFSSFLQGELPPAS
ncbi:Serine carboxypeptidase II-3 [Acorus gramineus]|uniref:Serine carboxypeptidase II-3 n=1 Tax=Acorus gramineus TaxID=55184 RepID=A0AAV9AG25_ACOGR|nr:Serine carboxypeptidase II-3 [Acorus gramineus]